MHPGTAWNRVTAAGSRQRTGSRTPGDAGAAKQLRCAAQAAIVRSTSVEATVMPH